MYIRNNLATSIYRLLIAILSILGVWMCFDRFGLSAWRVLLTYVLLVSALYFGILAVIGIAFRNRRKRILRSPMLEGALIISLLTTSITTFVFMANGWEHPVLIGGAAALSYVTLPLLMVANWLIFLPKGRWRGIFPFYWLAFPTIYVALMLFTAEVWPETIPRYPLEFLDYWQYDLVRMIWTLILYAVCILIVGYVLCVLDALMGGKVGKHIVMPKIKLIEIDPAEKRRPKAPSSTK